MDDYYENPYIKKEFSDEARRSMEGLQPPLADVEMLRRLRDAQNAYGGGGNATAGNPHKVTCATDRKATTFERWLKDMTDIINSFEEIERILDAIQNRINPMPQNPSDNKEEPFETTDHLTCMNRTIKNLAESRDSIRKKVVDISEFI